MHGQGGASDTPRGGPPGPDKDPTPIGSGSGSRSSRSVGSWGGVDRDGRGPNRAESGWWCRRRRKASQGPRRQTLAVHDVETGSPLEEVGRRREVQGLVAAPVPLVLGRAPPVARGEVHSREKDPSCPGDHTCHTVPRRHIVP